VKEIASRASVLFVSHDSIMYGAPRSLSMLVPWFGRLSRCEVVTIGEGGLVAALRANGIPVHMLSPPVDYRSGIRGLVVDRLMRQIGKIKNIWRIRRIARRMGADLVYVNTVARLSNIAGGVLSGKPTVVHIREVENFLAPESHIRRGLLRFVLARADRFITVSEASKAALLRACPGVDARIVHNGVESASFEVSEEARFEVRQKLDARDGQVLVGFIGKRSMRKGYDIFRDVVRRFGSVSQNLRFAAIGDDHQSIRPSGAEDSPNLIELDFQPEIEAYYAAFDIFVMASRQEPFSRVNLEAAAAGCAIIATDVDGNRELFTHEKNALLVSPGNAEAMADAIQRLAADPELRGRLAAAAQALVHEHYTLEACHQKILDNIADLLPPECSFEQQANEPTS